MQFIKQMVYFVSRKNVDPLREAIRKCISPAFVLQARRVATKVAPEGANAARRRVLVAPAAGVEEGAFSLSHVERTGLAMNAV